MDSVDEGFKFNKTSTKNKLSISHLKSLGFNEWCLPIKTSFLLRSHNYTKEWILKETNQKIFGQHKVFKTVLTQWQDILDSCSDVGSRGIIQIHLMNHVKYLLAYHKYNPIFMDTLLSFSLEKNYSIFDHFFKTYLQGIMVSRQGQIFDLPRNKIEEEFQDFMSNKTCLDLFKESGSTEKFWKKLFEITSFQMVDKIVKKESTLISIEGGLGVIHLRKDEVPAKYSYGRANPLTKTGFAPATFWGPVRSLIHIRYNKRYENFDELHEWSWFLKAIKKPNSKENEERLLNFCLNQRNCLKSVGKMVSLLCAKYPLEISSIKDSIFLKNPLAVPNEWLLECFYFYKNKKESSEFKHFVEEPRSWIYGERSLDPQGVFEELRKRMMRSQESKNKLRGVFNV